MGDLRKVFRLHIKRAFSSHKSIFAMQASDADPVGGVSAAWGAFYLALK